MTSTSVDRINGARSSLAFKAPVKSASIAALTLSGEQTVDGVALVTGNRVLVKNQASSVDNGIYIVDTGTWTRAPDSDGNSDWTKGTVVDVSDGATTSSFWQQTTAGPITIGTSALTFASISVPATISAFMSTVLVAADATAAFAALAAAGIAATGDITPTVLAASTDNWAPTGFATASTIRMASSLAVNLTGIAAGSDGRLILLHNIGAFAITLKNNLTSTAINRFQMTGDYVINPDASVFIEYDSTSTRWRIFGQQGTQASVSFNRLVNNAGLAVTMAANAVTIALKAADGTDASASNPVTVNTRSGTLTLGQVTQLTVQAALSVAISSGSTGGTVSAQPSRIWVAAINAGGTIELAWINALSGVNIANLDENQTITTIAEGGAGAADSAQVWYSTTARANVAFTILGYFESTQVTAGTWAAAAGKITVNPQHRPGNLLQLVRTTTGAMTTGTTVTFADNTIPQSGEGDQYMSQAITPIAGCNLLKIRSQLTLSNNQGPQALIGALFQDAVANALTAAYQAESTSGIMHQLGLDHAMVAAVVVATTFKVRAGGSVAGTTTFNGVAGAAFLGGVMNSFIEVSEVMA